MEVKKVNPIVSAKPATGVPVKPTVISSPIATPKPVSTPTTVTPASQVVTPTVVAEKEEPKGGLFAQPSVADKPKEERLQDVKNAVAKVENKISTKVTDTVKPDNKKESKKKEKKEEKPKWTGPRTIIVYGQELFVEENPDVSLEDIRKRIHEEFSFREFTAKNTKMSFDEETGIVVPLVSFEKRG